MNQKNNRQKGNQLEKYVVSLFQEIYPKCRVSKNSGANGELSDLVCPQFKIECKKRNTGNCIINHKVWQKLCGQLNIYNQEKPILILQNKYNETFCVLNIKDFISILKGNKNE